KYGFVDHGQLTRQTQALLDKLNIRLTADRLVGDLSIAAQQMVEIAKAVSWNADIVIMDEPTSALDLYYQQHLLRLLNRLTAGGQLHVCVVLHDLN
ncbi:ATP-binding cassette domain-containing protein, partial [Mycobacterium tuberculosis]|nr:ATP-binding cassette domain-containing protein [Mycobacterium tuberculosis]